MEITLLLKPLEQKMAKMHITTSAAVSTAAERNSQIIQPMIFLYVCSPFCRLFPSFFCRKVSLRPHTWMGLNQN
jgi:hypothetical protein